MENKNKIWLIIVVYLSAFLLIDLSGFYLLKWRPRGNANLPPDDKIPEGVEVASLNEVRSFLVSSQAIDYGCPKITNDGLVFYDKTGNVQVYYPNKGVLINGKFEYIGDSVTFFTTSNYLVACSYLPEKIYTAQFMNLENGEVPLSHKLEQGKSEVFRIEVIDNKAYIFYGTGYLEILDIKSDKILTKNQTKGTLMDVSLQKIENNSVFIVIIEDGAASQYEIDLIGLDGAVKSTLKFDNAPFSCKAIGKNLFILTGNRDKLTLITESGEIISEKQFPFTIDEISMNDGYIFIYGATSQSPESGAKFSAHFLILSEDLSTIKEFSSNDIQMNFTVQSSDTFLKESCFLIFTGDGEVVLLAPSKELRFKVPSGASGVLNRKTLYVISRYSNYIYLIDMDSGTLKKVLTSKVPLSQVKIFDGKVYFWGATYANENVNVSIYSE